MNLRLRYYRSTWIVAQFDVDNLQITQRLKAERDSLGGFDGYYDLLGPDLAILYRYQEVLWLRIGARVGPVPELSLALEANGDTARRLTVTWTDGTETRSQYSIEPEIPGDMTPMRELQDGDFGLRCVNIANNPARQQRIFNQDRT